MAPYQWRDLRGVDDHELRDKLRGPDCKHVATIGLAKSFARRSAYWLDLYHAPKSKWGDAWFVARQWSFTRDGTTVEGQTVSRRHGTPAIAGTDLQALLQEKLDKGWKIHETVQVDKEGFDQVDIAAFAMITRLVGVMETGTVQEKVVESKAVAKNRAERLRDMQRKRQAKADW